MLYLKHSELKFINDKYVALRMRTCDADAKLLLRSCQSLYTSIPCIIFLLSWQE